MLSSDLCDIQDCLESIIVARALIGEMGAKKYKIEVESENLFHITLIHTFSDLKRRQTYHFPRTYLTIGKEKQYYFQLYYQNATEAINSNTRLGIKDGRKEFQNKEDMIEFFSRYQHFFYF